MQMMRWRHNRLPCDDAARSLIKNVTAVSMSKNEQSSTNEVVVTDALHRYQESTYLSSTIRNESQYKASSSQSFGHDAIMEPGKALTCFTYAS